MATGIRMSSPTSDNHKMNSAVEDSNLFEFKSSHAEDVKLFRNSQDQLMFSAPSSNQIDLLFDHNEIITNF